MGFLTDLKIVWPACGDSLTKTCGTMQFRIEGFDSNLHVDAEFTLCDTGCCDSKKILHDPTYDNFSVFLTLSTRKRIRNRLSILKILISLSTNLCINSLGQPSLLRLPVVGLLVSRLGRRKKICMTPYPRPLHPFSFFPAHISLGGAPTIWMPGKGYSIYYSCLLNEHFCFIDININKNHASPV